MGNYDDRATRTKRSLMDILKWRFGPKAPPEDGVERGAFELERMEPNPELLAPGNFSLCWLGHASFLLQLGSTRLLIDPVLGPRVGPIKRLGPPGMEVGEVGEVDGVLITHNHRDHLDGWTVKQLKDRPFVCPLGNTPMLERYGVRHTQELEWWHSVQVGEATVHLVPARHWSMHFPWDRNNALWGGYVIEAGGLRIYHSGDTGFWEDFQDIRSKIGPIDYALLPVGAYAPRWFMSPQHMAPEESVRTAELVGARTMVAMHWGTFQLTDEHPAEGPALAEAAWHKAERPAEDLWILAAGETRRLLTSSP